MRTQVVSQSSRVGSQEAHRIRRFGHHSPDKREQAVVPVREETADRERATRNFLRNIRQREAKETRAMIHRAGWLEWRNGVRAADRLRMSSRAQPRGQG